MPMDVLLTFLYLVGMGMFFSYLVLVIYVSLWEGNEEGNDDDDKNDE